MNPNNSLRIFVAVPVPYEIKHAVDGWIDKIKPHLSFRKWIHQEDLHITLQFLGDTPSDRVPEITQVLQEISAENTLLSLRVGTLGSFGRPTHPSVLWAGVHGDLEGLQNLQQRVADALIPLGFTSEARTFHPHLTLARNYTCTTPFDRNRLSEFTIPLTPQGTPLAWESKEVTLYRSHLNKQPMYEAISET